MSIKTAHEPPRTSPIIVFSVWLGNVPGHAYIWSSKQTELLWYVKWPYCTILKVVPLEKKTGSLRVPQFYPSYQTLFDDIDVELETDHFCAVNRRVEILINFVSTKTLNSGHFSRWKELLKAVDAIWRPRQTSKLSAVKQTKVDRDVSKFTGHNWQFLRVKKY